MKSTKYNLFLISTILKSLEEVPLKTFITKNYDEATLYFRTFVVNKDDKKFYKLYKIGEIGKNIKFTSEKIFISSSLSYKNYKKEKELIEKAAKEKETKEIIKILWGGKEIE